MLLSLEWVSPCKKKLRHKFTLSRDIENQRIQQSDWTRGTTDHTYKTVVVSDVTFPSWLSTCNYSKLSIDSFQTIWWSKHTAIWLVKSILGHSQEFFSFPNQDFCKKFGSASLWPLRPSNKPVLRKSVNWHNTYWFTDILKETVS